MSLEIEAREFINRFQTAWQTKNFEGFNKYFHEEAVITGPGYVEFGCGGDKCAESYREFATNARILEYSESNQMLRVWAATAIYTYAWEMTYEREKGAKKENGTDQLIFERTAEGWQMVWRHIDFHSIL